MTHTVNSLRQKVSEASGLYHSLILLVGEPRAGKTKALQALSKAESWPFVNVSLQLSEALLELTQRQRALRAAELFGQMVKRAATETSEVVLLDNLELVFNPELELDPLKLLQHESRNRTLVAAWLGTWQAGKLTYAEPDHPEYRLYTSLDALVVAVGPSGKHGLGAQSS